MNLREELLKNHTKELILKIVNYVDNDKKRFSELMKLFFSNEEIISQRASWAVTSCSDVYPELILPYVERMLNNLNSTVHDSVKRNTIRTFQNIHIPEKFQGKAADICFTLLCSKEESIGTKVFSMTVLYNLSKQHPDLKNELRMAMEEQLPYSSAGFKSRGKKILKSLNT